MSDLPPIVVVPEVVYELKCRYGCDRDIVGVFYFPYGCVCLEEQVQALCHHHMARAAGNIQHGPMKRLLSLGDWPEDAPID